MPNTKYLKIVVPNLRAWAPIKVSKVYLKGQKQINKIRKKKQYFCYSNVCLVFLITNMNIWNGSHKVSISTTQV